MAKKQKISIFSIILLLFSLAFIFFPSLKASAIENGSAQIIATKCNLYEEANFSSDKVYIQDEEENTVIITLRFGDEVQVQQTQGDFALITTAKGVQGWVYKYYLSQSSSQEIYPVFNGTIIKETLIYDIDGVSTGFVAKNGARVFLFEGFDSKSEKPTAIQIVLDDGALFTGYVATDCVQPDGVSKTLIIAITIVAAATTIVLSLVFIRKKSKKKKEKIA